MKAARIGIAFAVVFLALPVAANAPISPESERQYENFVGQDPRIVDRFTRLAWARNVPAAMDFTAAQSLCSGGAPPLRVPTLKELLTLVDEEPNPTYDPTQGREIVKHIDQNAFDNEFRSPTDVPYWTSTIDPSSNQPYTVNFGDGTTNTTLRTDLRRARCVQALP